MSTCVRRSTKTKKNRSYLYDKIILRIAILQTPPGESKERGQKHPDMSFYDEVELEDLTFHPELLLYTYPCPCGDQFEICLSDMRNGEEVAVCPSCSLTIRVIFDQVSFSFSLAHTISPPAPSAGARRRETYITPNLSRRRGRKGDFGSKYRMSSQRE